MEYNITLTESAKKQLLTVATKNDVPYVRYSLNGGGCSGLIGKWENSAELEEGDIIIDLGENKQFIIDKFTIKEMPGAIIDYTGDFMPAFKVSIPDTLACGCGESFKKMDP